MKAWIYIGAFLLAAGMLTAVADETNTEAEAITNPPNTNAAVVAPPVAAPAVTNAVKPPVITLRVQTNAVPVQTNITAAPRIPAMTVAPIPLTATSAPAPVAPIEETNAVPALSEATNEPPPPTNAAAPPPESSGAGHTDIWVGGAVVLALAAGLAIFIWGRSNTASQGSLITSAMNENQKSNEDKNAPPPLA
jgi:hypothetical protein